MIPPLVRDWPEHSDQLGCVCADRHPVTRRRRRWGFHYELQSGSLGTLTPAYDVWVTIAASTGGDTRRLTAAPPAEVCALMGEVLTPAVGEIAGYVTESIHRHESASGDSPANTCYTLASCEANIRLQLAIWRTGQDPRDARAPEAAVAYARFYARAGPARGRTAAGLPNRAGGTAADPPPRTRGTTERPGDDRGDRSGLHLRHLQRCDPRPAGGDLRAGGLRAYQRSDAPPILAGEAVDEPRGEI